MPDKARSPRLLRPDWPDPDPDIEFVRSVGGIQRRPSGPIQGWDGEIAFCEARKLLRFSNLPGSQDIAFSVAHRRLFGFEYGYRLDVGLIAQSIRGITWKGLAEAALSLRVRVGNSKLTEIRNIGSVLAETLEQSTSGDKHQTHRLGTALLACTPAARVEDNSSAGRLETFKANGGIPCYRIVDPEGEISRRGVRSALWRLHTELEFIRGLNKMARQRLSDVDIKRATLLSGALTRNLARERREGVAQPPLIALEAAFGGLELAELLSLADALREQSIGVARRLEIAAENASRATAITVDARSAAGIKLSDLMTKRSEVNVYNIERVEQNIKSGKDSILLVGSSVDNSFNRTGITAGELQEALISLLQIAKEVRDPQDREEAIQLVDAMSEAARNGKPSIFARSWKRLQELAPIVSAGASVTNTIQRFLGL